MNIDFLYSAILSSSFGLSIGSIWQHLSVEISHLKISDEERAEIFLELLRRLMLEGHLKLASDGNYLSGSIDEQISIIALAWPVHPEEDELDGFGFWFLTTVPVGVVWFTSAGQEIWT